MTSTLFGIYNAQRALSLNQAVIDIINNNISNINTPGYSKQRAEISQLTSGYHSTIPANAAQDSMGAIIDAITRNRDAYLDSYFRNQNSDMSYYKELSENTGLIEDITNEIDNAGINSSLNEFYMALSQLSTNAQDFVLRNNVIQKAIELTTKFNSIYNQLANFRENLVGDYLQPDTLDSSRVKIITDELNDKLTAVANLNETIILSTAEGSSPNYLLDQRDKLLDEISEYIPVEIDTQTNGSVTISLGTTMLVSGKTQTGIFSVTSGDIDNPALLQIKNDSGGILVSDAYSLVDSGKLGAVLEMGGSEANKLTVKAVMDSLDTLALEFATAFNSLQTFDPMAPPAAIDEPRYIINGQLSDFNGGAGDPVPPYFFVDDAGTNLNINAGNITISQDLLDDPYKICASIGTTNLDETGDGANALAMFQIREQANAGLGDATTEQFIINTVSDIGSKANRINANYDIKDNITQQLGLKREAVTGVNLDEEMADLIRFQRSYEASAKIFNVVNENIKTILAMVG